MALDDLRHVHGPWAKIEDEPLMMRCVACGMHAPERRRPGHRRRIEDGLITQLSRFAMRQEEADRVED